MKISEILRLVWLNLSQNKFKVVLTSIGIVVGSATIMMVIAIGTGSRDEIAEQFKNLNAGAIDISCEGSTAGGTGFTMGGGRESSRGNSGGGGFGGGGMQMPGGGFPGGGGNSDSGFPGGGFSMGNFDFGNFFGFGSQGSSSEFITLTDDDGEDLMSYVDGLNDYTISYSTTTAVEGGDLDSESYYTVAGVTENYADISNLEMAVGEFISAENNESKEKVCVIGVTVAKEIFGSALDAYDAELYIDGRKYVVVGVLSEMGSMASGISPDTSIFIPYETGIKYITGTDISPTLTVIADNVDNVDNIVTELNSVLTDIYPNSEFEITDAGTKMEAASASNETLTLLLISMAIIVFIVGGIGIMNVLFVSVKERTNEIGILKALGCARKDILSEFILEAVFTSLVGAVLGVILSLGITPLVELFNVRVSLSVGGALLSLFFGLITGSIFGFYPAYKASRLVPIEAINAE